jgi:uncharacterized protein (DUF983 family)
MQVEFVEQKLALLIYFHLDVWLPGKLISRLLELELLKMLLMVVAPSLKLTLKVLVVRSEQAPSLLVVV